MRFRFAPTRESFIKPGSRKITCKVSGAVVYVHEYQGPVGKTRYSAVGFAGRANKPVFNYYYTSEKDRAEKITTFFKGQIAGIEAKAKWKAEGKARTAAAAENRKIGQIYVSSGGYNMTINTFYQVVGLKGTQSVEVREIGATTVDGDAGYQGMEIPVIDSFKKNGKTLTKRIVEGRIAVDHRGARLWDGQPCRFNHMD